ncbi:hypothetical protein JW916_06315 [Candidatus Sumerlaeota bacterium]|nr:hypothetical protein [Candidatus Sumerlaeota bacterium]
MLPWAQNRAYNWVRVMGENPPTPDVIGGLSFSTRRASGAERYIWLDNASIEQEGCDEIVWDACAVLDKQ